MGDSEPQEQLYRQLFDNAHDAILVFTPDTEVVLRGEDTKVPELPTIPAANFDAITASIARFVAKLEEVATQHVEQAAVDRNTMVAISGMGDVVLEFGTKGPDAGNVPNELSSEQASAVKLAEIFYRSAHETATKLAADDPQNVQAQLDVAISYDRLGDVQQGGRR